MRRLDLMIIKPLLIYKYEHGTHKKQKIFNELLMMEGEKLEEIFANKNASSSSGELRKSQLLDYLNAKGHLSEKVRSSHVEGDKSEKLDSDRSGIEMTNKCSSVKKNQEQQYASIYSDNVEKGNPSYPLLDK